MEMQPSLETLLICTVGNPEPVIAAIKHWRPARVRFVVTSTTKSTVETIVQSARAANVALGPGQCDCLELPDGEDLQSCLLRLRQLTPIVEEWEDRNVPETVVRYQVVVDFTGGTKCMTAAVALQASRWPCSFSYVGGTRTQSGIVASGSEKVIHQVNPWDALGYRSVDEFIILFDQGAFSSAVKVADEARKRVSQDRKGEFTSLEQLAKAFDAWDRFNHKSADATFRDVQKNANHLRSVLGDDRAERVLGEVTECMRALAALDRTSRSRAYVMDLLANALRRKEEGRFDDAVARLYRAIEALAQVRLNDDHKIDTSKVLLERIPANLREKWVQRADSGVLGLQESYELLADLGDSLGAKFRAVDLGNRTSPLAARNNSILAHGFTPVSNSIFDQLWKAALSLADCSENDLHRFPTLGSPGSAAD